MEAISKEDWQKQRSKKYTKVFFITIILITWLFWFPAFLIKNRDIDLLVPYNLFITAGTFVPSIGGFAFAYLYGGQKDVYLLFKSLVNVYIRAKWLFFIFLVLPGVSAVSSLIFVLSGNTLPPIQFSPVFIPVVFIYILIFMGPLGEEIGWRGFALKRMLKWATPINAAVTVGAIWSIWHLPLFFIKGTTQNTLTEFGIFSALFGYFLYTVMISVLITLIYIKSNGSVFASVLFHTVANLYLGFVPLIFIKKGALILLFSLSITTAITVYKYRKDFFTILS